MMKERAPANKGVKLLRYWLKGEGKTQAAMSDVLDISHEHLCRLIAGKFKPGLSLAVKIERACGIPCESWLERV
tara:strand:+ start:13 stop:234 length:222 start_codon:yes stop_codon:yes gene_type:complete